MCLASCVLLSEEDFLSSMPKLRYLIRLKNCILTLLQTRFSVSFAFSKLLRLPLIDIVGIICCFSGILLIFCILNEATLCILSILFFLRFSSFYSRKIRKNWKVECEASCIILSILIKIFWVCFCVKCLLPVFTITKGQRRYQLLLLLLSLLLLLFLFLFSSPLLLTFVGLFIGTRR